MACDIYKHLRASEDKKRPSTDFMAKVQKDINPSIRAILIDWLVEVAEEYRFLPDMLHLTINYIDQYLPGNLMDRQRLQLLGVACMMIASLWKNLDKIDNIQQLRKLEDSISKSLNEIAKQRDFEKDEVQGNVTF